MTKQAESETRRLRSVRRPGGLIALLAVAFSLLVVPTTAGAYHDTSAELADLKGVFKHVGDLPRFPSAAVVREEFGATVTIQANNLNGNNAAGGLPVLSPATKRIYQFYTLSNQRVGVLVRDLKTFALTDSFLLPSEFKSLVPFGYQTDGARGALPVAVDDDGRRLFFWLTAAPGSTDGIASRHGILTIQEADDVDDYTFTYKKLGIGPSDVTGATSNDPLDTEVGDPRFFDPEFARPEAAKGAYPVFQGVTYIDGILYAVFQGNVFTADPPAPLRLIALDSNTLRIHFDRPVRSCRAPYPEYVRNKGSGYMPVLLTGDALYVPCTSSSNATVVRLPLDSLEDPNGAEQTFVGTGGPFGYLVDDEAERIHFRVQAPQGPSVVTFDTKQLAFVGLQQVGTNPGGAFEAVAWGIDKITGRVYTQVQASFEVGLSRLDGRGTPVRPALTFEDYPKPVHNTQGLVPTMVERDHVFGRVFVQNHQTPAPLDQVFLAFEDEPPEPQVVIPNDPDANTNNLIEQQGITKASFSGEATGYGARQLVVGGVSGFVPNQVTSRSEVNDNVYKRPRCQVADRELIMGRVEDLRLSNGSVSGRSQAAFVDDGTKQDLETPSRCIDRGSAAAFTPIDNATNTLRGAVPWLFDIVEDAAPYNEMADANGQRWPFETAACTFDNPQKTVRPHKPLNLPPNADAQEDDLDPAFGGFEASVDCSQSSVVTATAQAGSPTMDSGGAIEGSAPGGAPESAPSTEAAPDLSVASASSVTSVGFEEKLGFVSTVESIARGVVLNFPDQGSLTIGGIYARTQTSAKGTPGTAKTSYQRVLWDVKAVGPDGIAHCELCATEDHMRQFAQGFTSAFGTKVEMRIPDPNPDLQKGTPQGYQAAIQRTDRDIINNTTVNGDSMRELPAVEILVYNDSVAWGRERQIFQFAAVKANAQYGISCFIGEPQGRRCVSPPEDRGAIAMSLTDHLGKPLGGGTFKAAGAGTCTTNANGGCLINDVDPGTYAVKQTKAPDGYTSAGEASVSVSPGAVAEASFVNLRNAGVVDVTLADADTKAPLAGGTFELLQDAGGGKPGGGIATCVTGADGRCLLNATNEFPLGSYVVVQRGAPEGYAALPDVVPFALEKPGQVATLGFVNGRTGGDVNVEVKGGGEVFIPTQPIATGLDEPPEAPFGGTGGYGGIPAAIGNTAKWLTRNPGDAALFLSSLLLFGSPLFASWRRRMLIDAATRNRS